MSEHGNKPETGFKTQEEIKLKVSENHAEGSSNSAQNCASVSTESSGLRDENPTSQMDGAIAPADETIQNRIENDRTESDKIDNSKIDEASELPGPKLSSSISYQRSSSSGLIRHKVIVATCAILSCSFLGFSTIDLKFLIEKPVTVSDDLTVKFVGDRPELPPGYSYVGSTFGSDSDAPTVDEEKGSDALHQIAKQGWNGRKIGYANSDGKVVIPAQFSGGGKFSSGLAPATLGEVADMKSGFIDATGAFKIPQSFDSAREFHNGAAPVSKSGRYGLIDTKGNLVLKLAFAEIDAIGDNFLVRTLRGKYGIVSPSGKWLLQPEYMNVRSLRNDQGASSPGNLLRTFYPFEEMRFNHVFEVMDWDSRLYGLVDDNGKWLLPAKFDNILSFENGVAAVRINGKIGFANTKGDLVIKPQFDQTTPYADLIAVRNHAQPWQFIDKSGNFVTGPIIDDIVTDGNGKWLSEGLAPFVQKGKVGYLNTKGVVVVKPQFDFGFPFVKKYAAVWSAGCWRFIDRSGNLMPLKIQSLSRFYDGKAFAVQPGLFYPLVEFSALKSIRENIANWMKNGKSRQPAPAVDWGDR